MTNSEQDMKKLLSRTLYTFITLLTVITLKAQEPQDSIPKDSTVVLPYEFSTYQSGSLYLNDYDNYDVRYDVEQNQYMLVTKIGDYEITYPILMTAEEYSNYRLKRDMHDYYKGKLGALNSKKKGNKEEQKNLLPKYYINSDFFKSVFGSNEIEVNMQGNIEVKMGLLFQETDNPNISEINRSTTIFDFNQNIGASVMAKVGERLKVSANYDTQSTFNFQDIVKLEFDPSMGYDDDGIIRKIEAGNVSMPIRNSLINGAQNLFGLRTELQFGKTTISTVFAKQQSQSKTVRAEGGAIIEEFEMQASDYDADRHFFLAHYFKDEFDVALKEYPLIGSSIQITSIELWVTNTNNTTNNVRNIVALADLAESKKLELDPENDNFGHDEIEIVLDEVLPNYLPENKVNELASVMTETGDIRFIGDVNQAFNDLGLTIPMQQGNDYSVLQNARRLVEGVDFKLDRQLGFISLNRRLAESDVLAVAYEYTINGSTEVYKVGELSSDGIIAPNNLVVKLLRGEMVVTDKPIWELMMKNIYNLQAYQLEEMGFRLEIMYKNDETGVPTNSIPAQTVGASDKTLLNLFYLDRLDQNDQLAADGDGYFDFVEGITIYANEGYMMFPKVEPFGDYIDEILTHAEDDNFIFNELYELTQSEVKNTFQQKDKYLIKGYYKTDSASGIALGAFNVPQGSVHVTSGGRELVEGVDYVVDYQIGRVKIINPAIEASNAPISVSVEQNAIFSQDRRTFFGVDVEHKFSENFVAGASFLNIREKPFTNKVFFGSEPINNSVLGLNLNYNTEAVALTRLVNLLPYSKTDATSNFSIRGDVAYLIPGTPKTIDINGQAASYIDDFDGTQTPLQIRSEEQWFLASTPANNSDLDLGANDPGLGYGKKRARFSWYNIDWDLYGSSRPANIDNEELSRAEVRRINYDELFPNDVLDQTESPTVRALNLAFFPNERGTYNYDTENVNADGSLMNPEERWGGMTRPLTITDFENSNIEYIQFWLLDPWTNYSITNAEGLPVGADPQNPNNQVGAFYINLGNISEDVLKDGSKAFENGLPGDGSNANTNVSLWGKIPTNQALLNSFENDDNIRLNQDIGLDGMNDSQEKAPGTDFPELSAFITDISNHATLNQAAKNRILDDPASDNFHFYKGSDLDSQSATIISRYKNYGRTQGNSPTMSMSSESYPTASTQYPDTEDINKDQTMSTAESYYQYKISLDPNELVVGENYIVDKRTRTIATQNGGSQEATWYQVRIPIASGESIGGINNFHSIRFMRMFMTGFKIPVVLRLGKMEMVRGEWRRYKFTLEDGNIALEGLELDNFESGVVNIEENEGREPIPYVLPPGIERERLQGTTTVQEQNEQALALKIRDLEEDDSRALFKNVNFDLRMFKRLQLFIHAESKAQNGIEDDELVAIIRIGSDLSENFYQIEQPLKITAHSQSTARDIWPEANELNIDLDALKKLKLARFETGGQANELFPFVAESELPTYRLRVRGHPNLGNVKTIMLGVKNKSVTGNKTGEIWFNEMRVSEFDNEGGWAAIVSADANFADLLDVSVSGRMSTQGYGDVDQSVNERSQENVKQYDAVSNLNAGKLFPKNWGLQIPISVSYGEEIKDPKYDAQYQDILLADTNSTNSEHRDDAQDYTKRTSISLINVKKNRNPQSKRKPKFYNFENLAFSYAYNEVLHRDYNIEKLLDQDVRASIGYTYSFKPLEITPFKNSKKLKGKYYKIIKDFNFNLLPNTIAINSNFLRDYNEQKSRVLVEGFTALPTLKQRNFLFDWDYSIGYKLTKALRLNFRALNNNVYDSFETTDDIGLYSNFFDIGRPTHYHQTLDASYEIPIDKIPLFSFIKSNYSYTADFDWQGASKSYVEEIGNTVQNANTHNLSVDLNMKKFYKEIGLPKLLRTKKQMRTVRKNRAKKKAAKKKAREEKKAAKTAEKEAKKSSSEANSSNESETSEKSSSENEAGQAGSEAGKKGEKGEQSQKGKKEGKGKNGFSSKQAPIARNGRNKSSKTFGGKLFKGVYDVVTSVDKIRISYQENNGTFLPGYKPNVGLLGRDNYSGGFAPSFGFVFGSQVDIRNKALENGWMLTRDIDDVYYNKIYSRTHYEKLDLTAKVSPFKNFDIDVTANKIYTRNISSQLDPVTDSGSAIPRYAPSVVTEQGNFSMSYLMLGTAFDDADVLFQQFKDNRDAIAQRYATNTGLDKDGYGATSQQVILPAFLAAYSGQSVDKVSLNPFRTIPLPNWQVRYRGLMKLKWFKKRFKSFSISHAYRSSYSVLNFANNLQYNANTPTATDITGNYFNERLFTNVGLIEEFSPLAKIEMKLKNSFSIEGRINQDRMMTLNFNNNTMTQNTGTEYVVGLGYRLKDIPFNMRIKGKKIRFKGDLNMKVDVSLRKDKMMVRYFGEDDDLNDQVTGGQNVFNLRVVADYALSKNLQAGFYYIQDASAYEITKSYDRRSISSGISVKYNLGN
ncbi:MAG TPA: cell surface protein SprA [Lutibacter sp.]|nr:cell surface protein SprA [Lutibacter sp.]